MGKKNRHDRAAVQTVLKLDSSNDPDRFENGLGEVVGFPEFSQIAHGMPADGYGGRGTQISQADTLNKNLRNFLITNMRYLLSQAYAEIGLIRTMVDVPVSDALKGGVVIKSSQLSEDDIKKLDIALERENDLQRVAQAAKWKRLFGGAGVLILTDQDPEEELDVEAIEEDSYLEFRAVDMWELYWNSASIEDDETTLERIDDTGHTYTYYGEEVNKSRVIKMKGLEAPSFIRGRLRGWGLSVVEVLVRSLNQYLKATDLAFEVLDEFKLDIYKIKGLSLALGSPNGEQAVRKRLAIANYQKNYNNGITMDSEDSFEHKQLSFSGLAEVMAGIRMQVASDLRMPITKLFGISAQGFNSGEDDIEVYNAMIESEIRTPMKYDILRVVQIRCQQLFGMIPEDLAIEFKPLRILSAEQEETVKTQKFTRLMQAKQAGEISTLEFRNAVNRGNLLDIQLEVKDLSLLGDDPDKIHQEPAIGVAEVGGEEDSELEEEDDDKPMMRALNSFTRTFLNSFREEDHPRADDGKFGSGGGSSGRKEKPNGTKAEKKPKRSETKAGEGRGAELEMAALKKKHPYLTAGNLEFVGTGNKEEAIKQGKALRADGKAAFIYHVEGPKSGSKSKYVIVNMKPQKGKDKGETEVPAVPKAADQAKGGDTKEEPKSADQPKEETAPAPKKAKKPKAEKMAPETIKAGDEVELSESGTKAKVDKVEETKEGKTAFVKFEDAEGRKKIRTYTYTAKDGWSLGGGNKRKSFLGIITKITQEAEGGKHSNSLGYEQTITTGTHVKSGVIEQTYFRLPKPYKRKHKLKRLLNSLAYDDAAYKADGAQGWIDQRRLGFFDKEKALDQGLWLEAEERGKAIRGVEDKSFVVWMYKKLGGTFH